MDCGNRSDPQTTKAPVTYQVEDDVNDIFFKIDDPKENSQISGKFTVQGRHEISTDSHVWILLHDGFSYYLQNPQVTLYQDKPGARIIVTPMEGFG
jgi:hypothetical protein